MRRTCSREGDHGVVRREGRTCATDLLERREGEARGEDAADEDRVGRVGQLVEQPVEQRRRVGLE